VIELRKTVPPNVSAAISKALEKLPADRFVSVKEFADAIRDPSFSTVTSARTLSSGRAAPRGRRRLAEFGGAALLVVVALWGWLRPAPEPTLHVSIHPPAGTAFLPNPRWAALSPDGRTIVFAAIGNGASRLYRRPVDGFRIEAIAGSEDATYPFFSPDGEWVGFFTRSRQLRKVALAGGRATTLTEIPFWQSGVAWRHDGTIVVVSDARGLYSVPDHGGALTPLAGADTATEGSRLDRPQTLRDGRLLATRVDLRRGPYAVQSLAVMGTSEAGWRRLPGANWGTYVEPGFLISRPGTEAVAVRFDLENGRTAGRPTPVLDVLLHRDSPF
jgi:serine/threonine-protein kinase